MNASITFWENWQEQVKEIVPGVHGHQKKALALCVLGMILSQSAVLQRMAEAIALQGKSLAKMPSIERRFARFVANERVQVSTIWKQFLTQVLASWKGKAHVMRNAIISKQGGEVEGDSRRYLKVVSALHSLLGPGRPRVGRAATLVESADQPGSASATSHP